MFWVGQTSFFYIRVRVSEEGWEISSGWRTVTDLTEKGPPPTCIRITGP
jgi:hypothetical protein